MELEYQKSTIKYASRALREIQNQEQTQEIKLSDGMPDIGRVLSAWGQVILRSKEWRSDEVAFSGGIMVWVLYAPEDGTDPRCVESWIPFQMKWDIRDNNREGSIHIRCLLRFVDARSVSARKLMVRAGVAALGEAFVPGTEEVSVPGEVPEDIQLLRSTYPIWLPKEAGEKTFLIDDDLTLPGSAPVPAKLIYYVVQPLLTEQRVTGNRVVFRGNTNLHVLYRSEEGQLHTWDFELPFSQLSDLDAVYDDAQADVSVMCTSLELSLDDEAHLRLKCGLLGQYLVNDRQNVEIVEDSYSPTRSVEVETEDLTLPAKLDARRENIFGEQTIPQNANIIVDTGFLPDFPRQRRTLNGVEFELPGQFQVLYYGEDGALQSSTARWEGQWNMDADSESRVEATVIPQGRPTAAIGSGQIHLKAEAGLQLDTASDQGIRMVTGLEIGQPAVDASRPSVILRRAGEASLWDIAKSTGSTMEAIREANGLTSEPTWNQILLIPIS